MTDKTTIEPTAKGIESYLKSKKDVKVSTILRTVMTAIRAALSKGIHVDKNFVYNDEDAVIAIRCAALDRWCPLDGPEKVEFGDKHIKYSRSGKHSMCKAGYNAYFKKYRLFNKQKEDLFDKLSTGEITKEQYESELKVYENEFQQPIPLKLGFYSRAECILYLQDEGLL